MDITSKNKCSQPSWKRLAHGSWCKSNMQSTKYDWMYVATLERCCRLGKVLLVGCGNGDLYAYLASWGREVYGVDTSEIAVRRSVARCLDLGLKGFFAVDDVTAIPVQDSCFDTVILLEFIERIEDPVPVLREARRLCRSGGEVIITVPNSNVTPDENHKKKFTDKSLEEIAVSCFGPNVSTIDGLPEKWIGVVVVNDKSETKTAGLVERHKPLEEYFSKVTPELLDATKYKVTVIIPTYNRANYLSDSIDSVINQSYSNIEIIVVNDGSSDNTSDVIKNYKNIIYLEQENAGKSAAINTALRVANGDFIWVMDDDDIANPHKAELQVRQFIKHPEVGIIGTEMCVMNADNSSIVSAILVPSCPQNEVFLKMLETNVISGCTAMIRRECFNKSGGYDENLIRSVDYDMHLRVVFDYPAKLINFPTIMMRAHQGVRGSGAAAFDTLEMKSMWKECNKIIFNKIYKEKDIENYKSNNEKINKNKLEYLSLIYTRLLGLMSNNCHDYALEDYKLMNDEIKKIKSDYYTTSDLKKNMQYIFFIQEKVVSKNNDLSKELLDEDIKLIKNLMDLYKNSLIRNLFLIYFKNKSFINIIKNKEILKYLYIRALNKIKNKFFL